MNTFDDIVLSYDLQLNQFKEELAFDQELLPAEMEYKSVTEREYNHDSLHSIQVMIYWRGIIFYADAKTGRTAQVI